MAYWSSQLPIKQLVLMDKARVTHHREGSPDTSPPLEYEHGAVCFVQQHN